MSARRRAIGPLLSAGAAVLFGCGSGADDGAEGAAAHRPAALDGPRTDDPASPDGRPPKPTDPEDAVFFLRPEEIEFGQIENGKGRKVELELENTTERPVSIVRVMTSCKCLKLRAEKMQVGAGEKVMLSGFVRNKGTQARVKVRCTVHLDSEEQRLVQSNIYFWAETQFVPKPRRFDLTQGTVGESYTTMLEVGYSLPLDKEPLKLIPIVAGALPLSLEEQPLEVVEKEKAQSLIHRWKLVVDTTSETEGELVGGLVLKAEGFTDHSIPITLRVSSGDWYLDNRKVHFGAMKPGDVKKRPFKVFYRAGLPEPEAVASSDVEGLAIETSVVHDVEKPHVLVDMVYTAPKRAGHLEGVVNLEASFSPTPIEIPVGARIRD